VGAPYWTCARTEPHREHVACDFLNRAGYRTYLPRIRTTTAANGRRVVRTPPLFCCYAFVRVELQWHAINRTIGVVSLVMTSGMPAKVPDAILDEIRSREENGVVALPEPPQLRPGDPVRVASGLFQGAGGLFSGMRSSDRVAVLLGVLGTVVLPVGDVEAG
jgi:transcriptional antiterminator RfaH